MPRAKDCGRAARAAFPFAWQYTHRFTATRVRVFAGGVLNYQEITHEKNLVGADGPARTFVQTKFLEGHTHLEKDRDDDLLWWSERVDRFLSEGREIFAYANNHYQNYSPSTLQRFLEIRHKSR
jgi:hypothetical protein